MRVNRRPHHVVRYAPVLRELRRLGRRPAVLEVGSGVEGLGTWWRRPFVGADLSFGPARVDHLRAVRADGARLPFRDRAFDLSCAVDVLPEVPDQLIAPLCAELARVTSGSVVVVSVCGSDAVESDRRLLDWCRRKRVAPPDWLVRQAEGDLPSTETIREALASLGRVEERANTSVGWHERMFRAERALARTRAMTVVQPVVRAWGRIAPVELPSGGPPYRRSFLLRMDATSSPPAATS